MAKNPHYLGKTNLVVSRVGFGGYRIAEREPEHREALIAALDQGCNLIDTSSNYTDGSSERLIGSVLQDRLASGRSQRDQIVVVTKAGYVQGANLVLAREHETQGRAFPEMVKLSPDLWHCISPTFLEDQLTRSLERLRLKYVDVFLLHNPECFLKAHGDHAEYYRRIGEAFRYLESEVERGRIRWYGVSSNTLPIERESHDFTSLEVLLDLAREAGTHFGVIQFPFNLLEPGAALLSPDPVTELARQAGLGTLINRPLNGFAQNHLVRLADFPETSDLDLPGSVREGLQALSETETRYPAADLVPARQIAWGHTIARNLDQITDLDFWREILKFQIRPSIESAVPQLKERNATWTNEYLGRAEKLFDAITRLLEAQSNLQTAPLREALDHAAPELENSPRLSQKVLRVYRSVPGIDCVLVGMRRPEYVRDVFEGLKQPDLSSQQARAALEAASNSWAESPAGHS